MERALVICTWGVGNMIQLTPTLQAIHELEYVIDLFASPVFPDQYDLLAGWDVINRIYLHPDEQPDFDSYDKLVYHHPARREPFSEYKKYKQDFRTVENGHPDPFWPNEVRANLELAVKLGRSPFSQDVPKCHVEYDTEWEKKIKCGNYEKKIIFAPTTHGNNDLWGPKMWLHWYDFIPAMAEERPNWEFWIVGSENDNNQPPEIDHHNVLNMIGDLKLKETAGLIKGADLVVANETGIGWIADALDVPCLTLWTSTHMRKNWPQSEKRIVLFKPVCQFQPCHTPRRIPGIFCPYIRAGQKHKCGYSFTTNQIYGMMLKALKITDERPREEENLSEEISP